MDRPSTLPRTVNPPHRPIAVSGIGVFCPIGGSCEELLESIRLGRSAIGPITAFDTSNLKIEHAAEIRGYDPLAHFAPEQAVALNRTAQFAIIAARRSLANADIDVDRLDPDRIGLVAGICAGGRSELPGFVPGHGSAPSAPAVEELLRCSHYAQTDALAVALRLRGPRATLSTACASSASALAYAYDWLQAGKVDVVLAGGADAFSPATYAGFYALGAMAPRPCSPFSEGIGVTFGEGAGFVVLEPLDRARTRGARVHGELISHGTSGDAHHFTAPHPSGEGLRRAMASAVTKSGIGLEAIDYINAHGTGTRDNDTAESLAIRELFRTRPAPPVSSTKSFFGHTLGPAGVLEFIVSLLAVGADLIPPTLNFTVPRAGCDLDYVPNHARTGQVHCFLSNSAAFGGVNVVLMGGRPEPDRRRPAWAPDDVLVTGLGVVSPVGCGVAAFRDALSHRRHGIATLDRFPTDGCRARHAALVRDFRPRTLAPTLDLRRADRINQYAAVAASLALRDAGLARNVIPDERIGIVMGLAHGPVVMQEKFQESLRRDGIENLSAKYFPAMVVSTIGGQVAQAFGLKGTNSTLVEGIGGGLHALIHAFELLRQDDALDAMVVVAADEIGSLLFRALDRVGMLAPDGQFRPYDPATRGMVLGEGAVALVLERAGSARRRSAPGQAEVAGYGLTSEAPAADAGATGDTRLARAIELALAEASIEPGAIDLIYGHGRGLPAYDGPEARTLAQVLGGRRVPVGCVNGHVGVAEAASGLFSVAAALLGLTRGEAYPLAGSGVVAPDVGLDLVCDGVRVGAYRTALVAGSTEAGNHAALVLRRPVASGDLP